MGRPWPEPTSTAQPVAEEHDSTQYRRAQDSAKATVPGPSLGFLAVGVTAAFGALGAGMHFGPAWGCIFGGSAVAILAAFWAWSVTAPAEENVDWRTPGDQYIEYTVPRAEVLPN